MIEEEEDNDDLNVIDPELISYSTTTRGGEQMIYLNKVYQIKKKIQTLHGHFRIQWHCKDRPHCSTRVMILSLRDDPMVQNDYNILWLGFEHNNNCNINGTSIVVEQFKRDLIERASLIHNMIDQPSQLSLYENLSGEYGNLELHPEVPPGLLLPTFYSMSSILSRVSEKRMECRVS